MPADHRYRGHADPNHINHQPEADPDANTQTEGEFTFLTLLDLSSTGKILFRITDPTSISPLYWTGDPSTSGFGCPNLYLASLDQQTYHQVFHHLSPTPTSTRSDTRFSSRSGSGWEEGHYIRHSVLDHVQAREKQTCLNTLTSIDERPGTPEDERSPWISTSNNLLWVIYDIVRRLVFLKRDTVYLTIISHPHSPHPSRPHVPSSPSSPPSHNQATRSGDEPGSGGARYGAREGLEKEDGRGREILINPIPILCINHTRAKELMLSVSMKENYDLARRASEMSGEMLIWGRVFGGSVMGHLEFTRDHTPLNLPLHFFKPPPPPAPDPTSPDQDKEMKVNVKVKVKRSKGKGKGKGSRWTDRLVWDPKVDDYDTVRQLVQDRYREMEMERERSTAEPKSNPKSKPEAKAKAARTSKSKSKSKS